MLSGLLFNLHKVGQSIYILNTLNLNKFKMKKLFFIAGVVAMTCTGFAQDMTFGAKAGLNLASMTGDNVSDDAEMLIGAFVGGYANFAMTEKFSIQPEIVFSMQGNKETFTDDIEGEVETETKLNYINIPVMAGYQVMEGLSLHTGPQLGILLSAEDEDGNDMKDGAKTTDVAWAVGGSYRLNNLSFDIRYNMGLTTTQEDDEYEEDGEMVTEEYDVKNSVIQFSVGYNF